MVIQFYKEQDIGNNFLRFKSQGAQIYLNRQHSLIQIIWDGKVDPFYVRQGYQLAVDLVRKFSIRNWLNDASRESYLDIESQNWICRYLVPQLVQYKVQRMARVIADEPLAMLVSCNILDNVYKYLEPNTLFEYEIFTDLDNALFWLNK